MARASGLVEAKAAVWSLKAESKKTISISMGLWLPSMVCSDPCVLVEPKWKSMWLKPYLDVRK